MAVTDPNLGQIFITRPNMRDSIRRKKGLTPPIDTLDGANIGDEPAGESWPGNVLLNQAIADSIREINRRTGFHSLTTLSIPVPAVTADGPQFFSLSGHVWGTQNTINSIKRVVWNDGSGNLIRLRPNDYRKMDRQWENIDRQQPCVPRYFFLEGYQLAIFPASSVVGTLQIWAGTGLINFCNDLDTLDELPIDYQEVIEDLAVVKLCQMKPSQPDSQAQLQIYGASSERGIDDIIKWLNRANEALQPSLIYRSNRRRRVV